MNNKKIYLILVLIIFIASFLRFWQLDKVPPGLFGDEVDVGYHAFSILKTGKDYYGQPWPIYIHSLAEWRAPLFIYSVVPSISILGLNEWGIRVPAALFGLLSTISLFFLVKELFSVRLALLSSLFLAITPWHIQYSRAGFEVTLMLFLLLTGVLFFIKALRKNSVYLVPSLILLALAPYTYSTAILFLPLLLVLLLILFKEEVRKVQLRLSIFVALAIFLLILFPLGKEIFFGQAAGRFNNLSVFQDTKVIEEINLSRKEALPENVSLENLSLVEKLFHNKVVSWVKLIGNNYLKAFSTDFLFVEGDPNERHSVGKLGELYWANLIFILLGLVSLIKVKQKNTGYKFTLGWLLLAPIASSLTIDGGAHATRLFLMLPPLVILSALGVSFLFEFSRDKRYGRLLLLVFTLVLVTETAFYLDRYWIHYPKYSWRWWSQGLKEGMIYVKDNQNEYQKVVLNDSFNHSLLYFLFWTNYSPERFQKEFQGDTYSVDILPGFNGFRLGKFYFGNLSEKTKQTIGLQGMIEPGMLYFAWQQDEVGGSWDWRGAHPKEIKVLKTVLNPYGEPIYYVVTKSNEG